MSKKVDGGKLLLALFVMAITTLLSLIIGVLVMIYGWGLTPQNWWVIIGGWITTFGVIFVKELVKDTLK